MLWDLTEGKLLSSLEAGDVINSLCFSPNKYWLCAAVGGSIKIWDLESKGVVDTLTPGIYPSPMVCISPKIKCVIWSISFMFSQMNLPTRARKLFRFNVFRLLGPVTELRCLLDTLIS